MHTHELLKHVVTSGASDLHISAGEVPAIRLHGEITRLNVEPWTAEHARRAIYALMNERQKKFFEEHMEADFSIGLSGLARFRVNVFELSRGIAAVFRVIPTKVLTMQDLNLPRGVQRVSKFKRGLVLVTGPTGSGKSTTLAAIIDHINKTRREHILTIEDPIEFVHTPKRCLISQRELGANTQSFSNALRSALREDPDVILVGEMRDLETISLALTAAETGHLVFGTLHTSSAPETIDRVIDVFPADQQEQVRAMLGTSLKAVIAQTLLPKTGGGRVAAIEILLCNFAVKNLIRENKIFQIHSLMQTAGNSGMQTLEGHLKELYFGGKIAKNVAVEASGNPKLFDEEPRKRS